MSVITDITVVGDITERTLARINEFTYERNGRQWDLGLGIVSEDAVEDVAGGGKVYTSEIAVASHNYFPSGPFCEFLDASGVRGVVVILDQEGLGLVWWNPDADHDYYTQEQITGWRRAVPVGSEDG